MPKILVLRGCKIAGTCYDENAIVEVDAGTALEFQVHGCGRYMVAAEAPKPGPMTMTARETATAAPAVETATAPLPTTKTLAPAAAPAD